MVLFTCMPARTPRCVQCLMYGSLYWEEKVNCFSVCPFERPPEAVQDIKSRHVRSHYASSSLIKLSSPATHTGAQDGLCHSNICWLQQLLSVVSYYVFYASYRPSTGIQVWMRWRELSRIVKGRSSTNSLESGTSLFSAETRPRRPASGEQVCRVSFVRTFSFLYSLRCLTQLMFVCYADAMPVDHEQYYGFTKFAIELNELHPSFKLLLPPTDTRLRVDQRYENNTENQKMQLKARFVMSAARTLSVKTTKTKGCSVMTLWSSVGSWELLSSLLSNHNCRWQYIWWDSSRSVQRKGTVLKVCYVIISVWKIPNLSKIINRMKK